MCTLFFSPTHCNKRDTTWIEKLSVSMNAAKGKSAFSRQQKPIPFILPPSSVFPGPAVCSEVGARQRDCNLSLQGLCKWLTCISCSFFICLLLPHFPCTLITLREYKTREARASSGGFPTASSVLDYKYLLFFNEWTHAQTCKEEIDVALNRVWDLLSWGEKRGCCPQFLQEVGGAPRGHVADP